MKLVLGDLYDLYVATMQIQQASEEFKFAAEVWIKLAVNSNILRPLGSGYELARTRLLADLNKENRERKREGPWSESEIQAMFIEKDTDLRAMEKEISSLETVLLNDLRIGDNPKIGGYLGRLFPMIADLNYAK